VDLMWRRVAVAVAAMAYVTGSACARRGEMRPDTVVVGNPAVYLAGAVREGRWVKLVADTLASAWVDTLSTRGIGTDSIVAWVRWSWREARPRFGKLWSHSLVETTIRCGGRTMLEGAVNMYEESGSLIETLPPTSATPETVIPGTNGEAVLRQLCTGFSDRRRSGPR
jgi:hypothetical protein